MNGKSAQTEFQVEFVIIFIFLVLWGFLELPWIVAAVLSGLFILALRWRSPHRYLRLLFVASFVAFPVPTQFAESLTREYARWVQLIAIFLGLQPSIFIAVIAWSRIEKSQATIGGARRE
jgi:hypothetical protein